MLGIIEVIESIIQGNVLSMVQWFGNGQGELGAALDEISGNVGEMFTTELYKNLQAKAVAIGQVLADKLFVIGVLFLGVRGGLLVVDSFRPDATGNPQGFTMSKFFQHILLLILLANYSEVIARVDTFLNNMVAVASFNTDSVANTVGTGAFLQAGAGLFQSSNVDIRKQENQVKAAYAIAAAGGNIKKIEKSMEFVQADQEATEDAQRGVQTGGAPIPSDREIDNLAEKGAELEQIKKEEETDDWLGWLKAGANGFLNVQALGATIAGAIGNGLVTFINSTLISIARVVVEKLSLVLSLIMMPFGVLAIIFTLMPWVADGSLKRWFVTWVGFKFWVVTLSVVDFMYVSFLDEYWEGTMSGNYVDGGTGMEMLYVNIIFAGVIIAVPFLTGLYIQSAAGGKMMSAIVGGATKIASVAKAGVTGGLSSVAGAAAGAAKGGLKGFGK